MPIAQPDLAVTTPGVPITIRPLANDSGSGLVLIGVTTPPSGSVLINPDQSLTYQPTSGFTGSDAFSYTLRDAVGATASAQVTLTVTAANQAPVARADQVTTLTGTAVLISPLANDSDPDQDLLRLITFTLPATGGLEMVDSRRLRYTPKAGFSGTDDFAYGIGDGRGSSATAAIRVVVQPQNRTPVAVQDTVSCVANSSATFNPLSNDSDPDGDAISLIGLTLPAHGKLSISTSGVLTYTPEAGYVGADEIIYTLRDSKGETATARVGLNVTAPTTPTYRNGYQYRRRLVLPQGSVASGTLTGFVLLVATTGSWLKSKANGGRVESGSGFDLRFELEDGTRLAHDLESFDPVAGSLTAWVRVPSLSTASLRLVLYYGKAGLAAGEADPDSVWFDHVVAWHMKDGADAAPGRHALTLSGTTDRKGPTGPAQSFGPGSLARIDAPAFLDGLAAFTLDLWVNSDRVGIDHGPIYVGPVGGEDPDSGLVIRQEALGTQGREARCWAVAMEVTGGRSRIETLEGTSGRGPRHLALVWRSGAGPSLFLDGSLAETSYVYGADRTGTTTLAKGPLQIGSGGLDRVWDGAIDEVRLRSTAISAVQLAAEHANQADPDTFYGLGGEDAFGDTELSPVALPIAASTRNNQVLTIDVVAKAYDPAA